jgi:hypothetical protein
MHIGSYDGTAYNYPTNPAYYLTNGTLSVNPFTLLQIDPGQSLSFRWDYLLGFQRPLGV